METTSANRKKEKNAKTQSTTKQMAAAAKMLSNFQQSMPNLRFYKQAWLKPTQENRHIRCNQNILRQIVDMKRVGLKKVFINKGIVQ